MNSKISSYKTNNEKGIKRQQFKSEHSEGLFGKVLIDKKKKNLKKVDNHVFNDKRCRKSIDLSCDQTANTLSAPSNRISLLINQITLHCKQITLSHHQTSMILNIFDPILGAITVRVGVNCKRLALDFSADFHQTGELIFENIPLLKKRLKEIGFITDRVRISSHKQTKSSDDSFLSNSESLSEQNGV